MRLQFLDSFYSGQSKAGSRTVWRSQANGQVGVGASRSKVGSRPENVDLPKTYQDAVGLLSPSQLEESPGFNLEAVKSLEVREREPEPQIPVVSVWQHFRCLGPSGQV